MAELPDRQGHEDAIVGVVAAELQRQFRDVMAGIDEGPDGLPIMGAPRALEETRGRMAQTLQPVLEAIWLASAAESFDAAIGIEWIALTEEAAFWAADYSFALVSGLNATTQRQLQLNVARAMQEGWSIPELRSRLAPWFGPSRAEAIAITETTRAATFGQHAWVDKLTSVGVSVITSWLTARDARVCWRCGPLDGMLRMPGGYQHPAGMVYDAPPAHVRCRCTELMEPV